MPDLPRDHDDQSDDQSDDQPDDPRDESGRPSDDALGDALSPEIAEVLARLTGGEVDPDLAKALKDMGIDQVDPAMLQMMVGQMQSMFASTDTDAFNLTLATDTARKTVSEAGDAVVGEAAQRQLDQAVQVAELWLDEVTAFEAPGISTHAWSRAEWVEATMKTWGTGVKLNSTSA